MAKEHVAFYKKYGHVMHKGECYRISSPFDSDLSVMQFIAPDKNTVIVFIASRQALPNAPYKRIVLQNLESDSEYIEKTKNIVASGDELCGIGLPFMNETEHFSDVLVFEKVK